MRPIPRQILLAAVLALCGAVAAPLVSGCAEPASDETEPTIVADDALLLHGSPAQIESVMRTLRRIGVTWVRLTADWSAIAPRPRDARAPDFDAAHPDAYPAAGWAALDRAVRAAQGDRISTMIDVAGRPPHWALDARGGIDPARFGRFSAAVARRYSGRFRGLPGAVAFGVWSEPNRSGSLGVTDTAGSARSATRYRRMAYAADAAIKRAAPGSLVLLGNTAGSGGERPGDIPPLRFLREMACVSAEERALRSADCAGFRPLPGDGWAHHPHTDRRPPWHTDADPDDVGIADLRRMTALLERLREGGRLRQALPVYVTAHGYETDPPAAGGVSLYLQARWLAEAERLAARTPGVHGFAQAPLRDRAARTAAVELPPASAGLEVADGAPKPALGAFAYPLVVLRGRDRVVIWGRVRPPSERGRYRICSLTANGTWQPLGQFRQGRSTDADGSFEITAETAWRGRPIDPRAHFRLELMYRGRWRPAGLPVFGAR